MVRIGILGITHQAPSWNAPDINLSLGEGVEAEPVLVWDGNRSWPLSVGRESGSLGGPLRGSGRLREGEWSGSEAIYSHPNQGDEGLGAGEKEEIHGTGGMEDVQDGLRPLGVSGSVSIQCTLFVMPIWRSPIFFQLGGCGMGKEADNTPML